MKVTVKIDVHHSVAPASTIEFEAEVLQTGKCKLSDHDLAGVLFAAEFAINNAASQMYGKPIRAHIFLK